MFRSAWIISLLARGCSGDLNAEVRADEARAARTLGKPVCFVGSEAYLKKVAGFRVSLAEAREKLLAERAREPRTPVGGWHHLIVGDEYVVSMKRMTGIPASGSYVNGETGAVRFVSGPEFKLADYPGWNRLMKASVSARD